MAEGSWRRVAVDVAHDRAELVADLLWTAGAAGIEEQAAPGAVRLLAGFPDAISAAAAMAALARAGVAGAQAGPIDDDGLDAWREHATAVRAGSWWLVPAWVPAPPLGPGERLLWLDPEQSFGSGSHPTTRLVVAALEDLASPGLRVLDVGCGSGVLSVAAALLGADVVAIDIDPGAPGATRANAERNGVGDRIAASTTPLDEVDETFDVVAANLLAPVVAELGPGLVRTTRPGGHLVVSGLLADRWEASLPHLAPLEVLEVRELDGWVAVVLGQGR